jgi:hypothetical protein
MYGMGISLYDVLVVQTPANKVSVFSFRDRQTGKHGVEIGYTPEGGNYHTLLTSNATFRTGREAEKAGKDIVSKLRKMDVSEQARKLRGILSPEEIETTREIIEASRK